jgi:archaeosine-15-forming tRNA-guanine transglycosylase
MPNYKINLSKTTNLFAIVKNNENILKIQTNDKYLSLGIVGHQQDWSC